MEPREPGGPPRHYGSEHVQAAAPREKPELSAGDRVVILGLESEGGRQLNGQTAVVLRFLEDRGRHEVRVVEGGAVVSVKPVNLRFVSAGVPAATSTRGSADAAKPAAYDSRWAPGDQARLVGLLGVDTSSALQAVNSSLAKLVAREDSTSWTVEVHGTRHKVPARNIRVCTCDDEERWCLMSWRTSYQLLLVCALVVTILLLVEAHMMVEHVADLTADAAAAVPGLRVAALSTLAPVGSLAWIIGTVAGCYALHESLLDPKVTFPQISELGVGPMTAKVLYRIGFSAAAALLAATILLHQELALPHLPGGRQGDLGANFTFYGLMSATGVAAQGIFLLGPEASGQSAAHGVGALLFFYGVWCTMGAAQQLYLPAESGALEGSDAWDEAMVAAEAASVSMLLQHPVVYAIVEFRHRILMRAPLAVFLVPLYSQFAERVPMASPTATMPGVRSMMGLAQWLVVFDFALIFMSYGPELVVAAMLPVPTEMLGKG